VDNDEDVYLTEGLFAEPNIAKVWVVEDNIVPGYAFHEWLGVDYYPSEYEAFVLMDEAKTVTATFETIDYDLTVDAYPEPAPGNITVGQRTPTTSDAVTYTVEDPLIKVTGEAWPQDDEKEYRLLGFYYDENYEYPVKDAGDQVVLDAYAFDDGVMYKEFFFVPVVPSHIPDVGFDDDEKGGKVTIYARFASRQLGYMVNLETKLYGSDTYNEPVMFTELDIDGQGAEGVDFDFEEIVNVTTAADWGYSFKHWKYKDGSVIVAQPTFNFEVVEDATLVAVFTADEYDVTVEVEGEYADEVGGEASIVNDGPFTRIVDPEIQVDEVTDGWEFTGWTSMPETEFDDEEMNFVYEVTEDVMDNGEITFTANFERKEYEVILTANPEEGGEVTGAGTYLHLEEVEVDAIAATGWEFVNWTDEDGNEVSDEAFNELTIEAADIVLTANFEIIDYVLTLEALPQEDAGQVIITALGTSSTTFNFEDVIEIEAIANEEEGWSFVRWEPAGYVQNVTATTTFTEELPDYDVNITAVFEQETSSIAGQVRYYNNTGTAMPNGHFQVRLLHEDGSKHAHWIDVDYDSATGLNAYFEFDELEVGTYTIQVRDNSGYTDNLWDHLSVTATDALIIQQIALETPQHNRPWLWVSDDDNGEFTPFGNMLADVHGDGSVTVDDAFRTMQRVVGQMVDFDVDDFQVSAVEGPTASPRSEAPENLFTKGDNGYLEGTIDIEFGDHTIDLFYIATADMRARSIPQQMDLASGMNIQYNDIQTVAVGDKITLPISLTSGANLGAYTIDLGYDSNVLDITDVTGNQIVFNATDATITIASTEGVDISKGDALVEIHATVVGDIHENDQFFTVAHRSEIATPAAEVIEGIDFETTAVTTDGSVDVIDPDADAFTINNFPNPFNEQTTIRYTLPETADVQLVVYNQNGQVVSTLVDENQTSGTHEVTFNRESLQSGVYFYRIVVEGETDTYSSTESMVIMR